MMSTTLPNNDGGRNVILINDSLKKVTATQTLEHSFLHEKKLATGKILSATLVKLKCQKVLKISNMQTICCIPLLS